MPRDRIPAFTVQLERVCEAAGLPPFDDTHYDLLRDELFFIWHDPQFVIGADLGRSSVYGMTPDLLLEAWERKHGGRAAA